MKHVHSSSVRFDFDEDRHLGVFVCQHVFEGAPILFVSHDADGDWQFLCGETHDEGAGEQPRLVGLEHLVARDPTLNALARLCGGHHAERAGPGAPWQETDPHEAFIRERVSSGGWAIQLIPADEEPYSPAFAYTTGLYENFKHPELIVFGLPLEVMEGILDICGDRVRSGERLVAGLRAADVLEGYDVQFHAVSAEQSYREHVGYALWFYQGMSFPLLQVVWPDKAGHFPGDVGFASVLARQQALLP